MLESPVPGIEDRDDNKVESHRHELSSQLLDGPVQDLVSARIRLLSLMSANEPFRAALAPLAALIEAALAELTEVMQTIAIDPVPEQDQGATRPDLYIQLGELCAEFGRETGIGCSFEIEPGHTHFGHHLSDVVHHSVRELLTNVRKHAQATQVRLRSGRLGDGSVYLSVEDNGVGFGSISRLRSGGEDRGFGLWSIEHRLRHFDAFTEIESIDGVGVRIILPARLLEA